MMENKQYKDFQKFALSRGIGSNLLDSYCNYIEPAIIEERNSPLISLSIFSRLMMDRIVFLGTEINSDVANIISAQLLWLEQQGDTDITIQIASPGGSIYSGYVILDSMNYIKPDVSTVSYGNGGINGNNNCKQWNKGETFYPSSCKILDPSTNVRYIPRNTGIGYSNTCT